MFELLSFAPLEAIEGRLPGNMLREDKLREDAHELTITNYIHLTDLLRTPTPQPPQVAPSRPRTPPNTKGKGTPSHGFASRLCFTASLASLRRRLRGGGRCRDPPRLGPTETVQAGRCLAMGIPPRPTRRRPVTPRPSV